MDLVISLTVLAVCLLGAVISSDRLDRAGFALIASAQVAMLLEAPEIALGFMAVWFAVLATQIVRRFRKGRRTASHLDISDKQTASSTLDDDELSEGSTEQLLERCNANRVSKEKILAQAKIDAASMTGDYSDISDRDIDLYDYASEFERRRLRREIIKFKGLGGLYGGSP